MNIKSLSVESSVDIEISLDKLLKFTCHLIDEIHDKPKEADFFRGEEYVDITLGFLRDMGYISPIEDTVLRGNSIENAIFIILEKLIISDYFIDGINDIEDCSYAISRTYAIHIYTNLGQLLRNIVLDFDTLHGDHETKLLTYYPTIDEEIEQETLESIFILTRGTHLVYKADATTLNNYLKLLRKKGIITENELIHAISTDDILETLESIIQEKLIAPGKIISQHIINAFNQFRHAFIKSKQEDSKNKVITILNPEDENLENQANDPLLLKLSTGVSILQYLYEVGGELYDYDVYELVTLAAEMDIINSQITHQLLKKLEYDTGNKAQVILEVFEYVFYSGYFDEIKITEEERVQLKSHYSDILYALNMLYKD